MNMKYKPTGKVYSDIEAELVCDWIGAGKELWEPTKEPVNAKITK